jgi:hypothetical protein
MAAAPTAIPSAVASSAIMSTGPDARRTLGVKVNKGGTVDAV